jgi:hypothetical protein
MEAKKITLMVTVGLAILSLASMVACFLALTDIWHELGSPDFWHGQGQSSLEWRILGYTFPAIALFHLVFLVTATIKMASWNKE